MMVNMDMVGRLNDSPVVLGGVGSSGNFVNIIEDASNSHTLEIETNMGGMDFGRSDHASFYRENIPVLFFFTGAHEDYHKPTDTIDKIMFNKTADIARYIFLTTWTLANREDRLQLDGEDASKVER